MKAIVRTTALAAVLAGVAMASPASAAPPGIGYYRGPAMINCFGCGSSTGTAALQFTGVYNNYAVVLGNAQANYTVSEPAGATCVVSGTASGTVSGVLDLSFNWTRIGALAVVSTTGDVNGASVAAFAVTSPVGVPCGGPVTADVQGAIAGAF